MDYKHWDIYETAKNLYEDVIQKGETFSIDMGKEIEKELEKMKRQRDEWLNNNHKEKESN